MAFIDGAHDEESVRQDIRAMLPLLEPRALVLFHDYLPEAAPGTGYPGVHRAFQTELADRVEIVDRAFSLLVTRLKR
jgi:predicted O-methyltransferase YrrM